jgi:hypothetical protein
MKKKVEIANLKIVNLGLFPFDICVAIGTTEKEVIDFLKSKCGYILDDDEKDALQFDNSSKVGRTVILKNNATVLWVKRPEPGVIAHEAFHVMDFITARMGIKHTDDSDEVWGYGIEYIVRKSLEKL